MIKIETEKIFARKNGGKLLKGKTIYCPNQSAADEWQEFDSKQAAYDYYGLKMPDENKDV